VPELRGRALGEVREALVADPLMKVFDDMGQDPGKLTARKPVRRGAHGIAHQPHQGGKQRVPQSEPVCIAFVVAFIGAQHLRAGVQPVVFEHEAARRAANQLSLFDGQTACFLRMKHEAGELRGS